MGVESSSLGKEGKEKGNGSINEMAQQSWRLTATEALEAIQAGDMTIEEYARSLLARIKQRDAKVEAWAYLNEDLVLEQAKALDKVPMKKRGPLHGLPVGVKDVIYTKDMPTQHNSAIYKDDQPKVDAGTVTILRHAGCLIFGKTTTTEFAATTYGPKTHNPHDPKRTPGGSSSGSGAAVGDFQAPITLGTQTGGSTIRPGSFNGIYAFKPTWNAISREGQKIYALIFDTLGIYARSVDDIELMADVFALHDDEPSSFTEIKRAKFAVCKTMCWEFAGPGTKAALEKAVSLLQAHGATVDPMTLPSSFDPLPEWHRVALHCEGRANFLPEYRIAKDKMHGLLTGHVENEHHFTRKMQLQAFDGMAALRPQVDAFLSRYDALLVPSVPDEAPVGLEFTGDAIFCSPWTALHVPVINIPGFKGPNGMPIGVSLVTARFRDRHLLQVGKEVGKIFEAEGGWTRPVHM